MLSVGSLGPSPEFQAIFRSSLDAILVTRPGGQILRANPAACQVLGLSEAELLQSHRSALADARDPRLAGALETRERTGSFRGELTFLRRGSEPFPVEVVSTIVPDEGGNPVTLLIFRDITDRKVAAATLRSSEEKFFQVFHTSPDGVAITELADGRYLEVNEGFEVLTGYRPEEVLGRTSLELAVWTSPRQREEFVRTLRDQGEVSNLEVDFAYKGGVVKTTLVSARRLDFGGTPCILSTCRDITERKRSADLLALERERLAVTVASIRDGVIAVDSRGQVLLMNPAAGRLCGVDPSQAVGTPLALWWKAIHEMTREPLADLVPGDLPPHMVLRSQEGTEVPIEGSVTSLQARDDRVTGVVLVFRDLTERLRLTESQLRAQKLESIGLLAGGIAHDFNNMLGGIFGFLQLAQENLAQGRGTLVPQNLDKALGIYGRAKGLTQQLLTFAKGQPHLRQPLRLGELLRSSAAFALSGSNLECRFDLGDLWLCEGDETQIGQVIDNLLLNAKQAMPGGGVLVVAARNRVDPPGRPGSFLEVSVTDQGPGIPPENLSRVFDPFFSTKATGHGLGLASVDSILRRHDGWIEVESPPGQGATFRFFLPARPRGRDRVRPPSPEGHRGSGTLLVLDDDEALLETLGGLLGTLGYQTVACRRGDEALNRYSEALASGHPFRAAILDLTIRGGRGGAEVAQELRALHPQAVLIAVTGYSEDPPSPTPDAGFSGRLVKPFLKKDLAQILSDLLP